MSELNQSAEVCIAGEALAEPRAVVQSVLDVLRERRGLDFTGYRAATIERRIANRMLACRSVDAVSYLTLLRSSEDEVDRLAANLTIKVSRFYRNAGTFDLLRRDLIPSLRAAFPLQPIRAWSAGCATGEEAWTLAMLLDGRGESVIASDIDHRAIAVAAAGEYAAAALDELPQSLCSRFIQSNATGALEVTADLRRRVSFTVHDLARDSTLPVRAPFHLVCCRNVLIYFARELQRHAMSLVIDSVVPGGVICFGEAEWPGGFEWRLDVIDRKMKIFRRKADQETTR